MNKFFPEGTEPTAPESSDIKDLDAKHMQDIQQIRYNNRKLFHKMLPWVTIIIVSFLMLLFFVVLPVPEIPLRNERTGHVLRYYFIALRSTGSTAFLTLLAIVGSELLKQLYKYIRYLANNDT